MRQSNLFHDSGLLQLPLPGTLGIETLWSLTSTWLVQLSAHMFGCPARQPPLAPGTCEGMAGTLAVGQRVKHQANGWCLHPLLLKIAPFWWDFRRSICLHSCSIILMPYSKSSCLLAAIKQCFPPAGSPRLYLSLSNFAVGLKSSRLDCPHARLTTLGILDSSSHDWSSNHLWQIQKQAGRRVAVFDYAGLQGFGLGRLHPGYVSGKGQIPSPFSGLRSAQWAGGVRENAAQLNALGFGCPSNSPKPQSCLACKPCERCRDCNLANQKVHIPSLGLQPLVELLCCLCNK